MSKDKKTFIDLCLAGDADIDDIEDFEDSWHESNSSLPLYEFLGMTEAEYGLFVEKPVALKFIIAARKYRRPAAELIKEATTAQPLAARSGSDTDAEELLRWLKKTKRI